MSTKGILHLPLSPLTQYLRTGIRPTVMVTVHLIGSEPMPFAPFRHARSCFRWWVYHLPCPYSVWRDPKSLQCSSLWRDAEPSRYVSASTVQYLRTWCGKVTWRRRGCDAEVLWTRRQPLPPAGLRLGTAQAAHGPWCGTSTYERYESSFRTCRAVYEAVPVAGDWCRNSTE